MKRLIKDFVRKVAFAAHAGFAYNWLSGKHRELGMRCEKHAIRRNYAKIVKRIRKYPRTRKIRVAFLVTETAKWKAQSLYDEMKRSYDFEPFIVLSALKEDVKFHGDGLNDKLGNDRTFYERLGCRCITDFDFNVGRPHRLAEYSPDIVFYQDPWPFFNEISVRETAKTALCCDVPYAIRTVWGGTGLQSRPNYHQLMYLQFPPTEAQGRFYRSELPEWQWAGTSCAVGHPILDQYCVGEEVDIPDQDRYVIYAPHYSFPVSGLKRIITISSFLENGREILAYAKAHREFRWLFKPHPGLYKELIQHDVWTRGEVDAYYREWGGIGEVRLGGDYIKDFRHARALITDCGSFLVEFPITGRPLIRLIPKVMEYPVFPAFLKLYESFYSVHDLAEMHSTFEQVLERGEDPKREERLKAVRELGLIGDKSSAERIMEKLREVCGRKEAAR